MDSNGTYNEIIQLILNNNCRSIDLSDIGIIQPVIDYFRDRLIMTVYWYQWSFSVWS